MGRNRVLSFMSQFSTGSPRNSFIASPESTTLPDDSFTKAHLENYNIYNPVQHPPTPPRESPDNHADSPVADPPSARSRTRSRSSSRPLSMVQAYQPPLMDVNEDTLPELQPIFTFLNSHANKLYQEGYFLKLDDQNTQGRANPDRTWTEHFAQLVGTVLSLWDAAELDAAGEDGEVLPKFINLTDASIKMIDSLPTRSNDEQPLENILSISTAGRNRYLLHFNSRHSLIQWTAGIRLAMFEHSTLQEAYTGALIAGKGKTLNNIGVIMERSRQKTEEWVRVRFGAGVPWKRCWCVITPPDEKEYQKLQRELKKRSPYDRSHPPVLKGDIKFYDTRKEGKKQKKAKPIATITDAYSSYALYPQAKSLIDASTLIKIEGNITIHSDPPTSTEGFVFVMPEVHPAVSGFEMMLKSLFPTWDTFALYGRPGRLVASTLDPRSLMFAMPKHKRYGYLEILDVTGLILTEGSSSWTEREWKKRLKDLTGQRITTIEDKPPSTTTSRANSRSSKRLSFGTSAGGASNSNLKPRVGFSDDGSPSVRTSRSMSLNHRALPRTDSAPPGQDREPMPSSLAGAAKSGHTRNASDSRLSVVPPTFTDSTVDDLMHRSPVAARAIGNDLAPTPERVSSDVEPPMKDMDGMRHLEAPEPVSQPPAFSHAPGHRPTQRPYHSPELRRANSRMSSTTLAQLAEAGGVEGVAAKQGWINESRRSNEDQRPAPVQDDQRGPALVHTHANNAGMSANGGSHEVLNGNNNNMMVPPPLNSKRSKSPLNQQQMGSAPGSRTGSPALSRDSPGPNGRFPPGRGPSPNNMPPPSPRGPPPNMPPVARGPPPPGNMGRSGPRGGPPNNQYRGYPQGPPPGQARPTTPGDGRHLPPSHTSPPIHRKPLPARTDSLQHRQRHHEEHAPGSTTPSSNGSFTRAIDQNVLAHIHTFNNSSGRSTPQPESEPDQPPARSIRRQDTMRSMASSAYDSTDSPDYASTRPSMDSTPPIPERADRPRAGVLRTVGDDTVTQPGKPTTNNRSDLNIPDVDFGPTLNYGANQARNKTPGPPGPATSAPTRSFSPAPPPPPMKSPPPEPMHARQESNPSRQESDDSKRRSIAWQPGTGTMNSSSGTSGSHGISAEQFVQQRAAAAATPLYSHQRQPSGGYRGGTPTPPLDGTGRPGYMTSHSRTNSQDLLQRPGSRGAGAVLGGQGRGGDTQLSAREQEHVARITGTPLVSMASSNSAPPPGGGLVGAIEAREREKQQMKQGYSGQAVQQAINQRQQLPFQNYNQPLASPGLPPPAGMYANMGRGVMMGAPQAPGMMPMRPQSPGMMNTPRSPGPGAAFPLMSPGAQAYAQGGGWQSPGMRTPMQANFFPPAQGQFSPQYGSPLQSPRSQAPRPGQQGYNPAYQGQAF